MNDRKVRYLAAVAAAALSLTACMGTGGGSPTPSGDASAQGDAYVSQSNGVAFPAAASRPANRTRQRRFTADHLTDH